MYKLTILFFFLTAFSSTGLMDSYKITFEYDYASYILNINDGELIFENNQPYVTVTPIGDNADNTDKAPPNGSGKIYKITKGATFEEGLKIGAMDGIAAEKIGEMDGVSVEKIGGMDGVSVDKIGEMDDIAVDKIGEMDDVSVEKIGEMDGVSGDKEINPLLFGVKEHQAYEIVLSYALVTVVEKSSKMKTEFPIANGVYLIISDGKFAFFK